MARVIVAASPFQGHVAPLARVAADLVERGHEVLFWTGAAFAEDARHTGARFVALPRDVDFDGRDMTQDFPEFAQLSAGAEMHRFFWNRLFIDALPAQYLGLRKLLAEFAASVIIHDPVFLGALPLAAGAVGAARPHTICLGVLPPMLSSEDAVPFAMGATARDGAAGPAAIQELNGAARRVYADVQAHAERVFQALDVRLNQFIFSATVRMPDHYLQLTAPGFEYPRNDLPRSFRFIGSLPASPSTYREPSWWSELSAGRPVVVVTQGTLANDDLGELIVPTILALADADVLLIVATAREDGPAVVQELLPAVPANARLNGYVPFDRLLPLAQVLVTNGGYGGVNTALRHGVPLVVAGDTEDKLDVSARVEWSGVGVDVRTGRPTPAALRAAVERVLNEPSFRQAAATLQAQLARYHPLDLIAEVVESAPSTRTQVRS